MHIKLSEIKTGMKGQPVCRVAVTSLVVTAPTFGEVHGFTQND
ncbi:hypothetical protein KGM_200054 [Danaus plexippus plexippus]|uniref:Uncharacterized protein n=1 Tax=Danaus plexippus plexippus TaxID=278856 RepID=A0A212ET11_DANPL|nr:hypothetical protein KGM_200054 [Danaus plexippus plexippus]